MKSLRDRSKLIRPVKNLLVISREATIATKNRMIGKLKLRRFGSNRKLVSRETETSREISSRRNLSQIL